MKIVLSVALAFLLVGCGSQEETQKVEKIESEKVVVNTTASKVIEVSQTVEEEVVPSSLKTVQKATKIIKKVVSAESIFKACSSCHGQNAEKKALGKSQVIKGWDTIKVIDALNGYKVGTYGGSMKGLMKGQVLKLSDADIKAVAGYISKL